MAGMPTEPTAFAEQVVTILRTKQPEYTVLLTSPTELIVNGRRLDLDRHCHAEGCRRKPGRRERSVLGKQWQRHNFKVFADENRRPR